MADLTFAHIIPLAVRDRNNNNDDDDTIGADIARTQTPSTTAR